MRRKMARLQIIGLKSRRQQTITLLHQLGCVQIDDLAAAALPHVRPYTPDHQTAQQRETLSHLIARIESLLKVWDWSEPVAANGGPPEPTHIRQQLKPLTAEIQELVTKQESLQAEQASLPRYETTLRKLMPIVPPEAQKAENVSVVVLVSQAHRWVLQNIAEQVTDVAGDRATLLEEEVAPDMRAMLIVIPREQAPALQTILGREDISQLRLPDEFAGQPPDVAVASLSKRMAAIPKQLAEINATLTALAQEWAPTLVLWRGQLRHQRDEIAILERLGETEQTFVLCGWIPEADISIVEKTMAEQIGPDLFIQPLPLSPEEEKLAPVALVNPAPARPFQSLVKLLAYPRYNGIDPTILMALFMPLFFGIILGDVGYGILLLLLSLVGLRRFRQPGTTRDIIKILGLGAVWSIIFGLLYGEAFGTLGEALGMHAIWLPRASPDHVAGLLIFAIAVGAVHVTLGLLLGVWVAWQERHRHALLERGGMLVGLIGLYLLTAVLAQWLPHNLMTPAIAILIVGVVLLSAAPGWIGILLGPIEFIGLLGNILSYLRLAAVGLASVYVAVVANELAGSLGNLIVGAIVAILIHGLNLVLGAFSPTIHSMRLHYVEFFRKFYEGGGRPFEPFQKQPIN